MTAIIDNTNKATKATAAAADQRLNSVLEAQTPEEVAPVDTKAQASVTAIEEQSKPLNWTDIVISSSICAAAVGLRRVVNKVAVDQYAADTEQDIESQSYLSITAHAAASAAVTAGAFAVAQKTFLKNQPDYLAPAIGGLIASMVNLVDATVGDDMVSGAVQLFGYGKDKMTSNEEVVVEQA